MFQVEGYKVESEIARGAMGVVYRAHDPEGHAVALKVMLADPTNREDSGRFQREVEVIRRMRHPGIVSLRDSGRVRGKTFLVLDLLEGGSLADRLKREGRLDPDEAARVVLQLAEALAYAHAEGVLHRDVKPANILLGEGGRPVLTDFGLARFHGPERLTQTGLTVGTPAYMAPEQIEGDRSKMGPPADVYALGGVLYELLTGQPPLRGKSLNHLLERVLRDAPTPPSQLNADLDQALEEICLRCLEKDPAQRYRSADALAEDLREFLAREATAAAPARPRPRLWLGVAAALGLVLIAAGLALRGDRPTEPSAIHEPAPGERRTTGAGPTPPAPGDQHELLLQPGPVDGKDSYVQTAGDRANNNYGALGVLKVGDRDLGQPGDYRAFLEFDLSHLDRTSTIQRATLALWLEGSDYRDEVLEVRVEPVIETRNKSGQGKRQTPWVEGTYDRDSNLNGIAWDGVCVIDASAIRNRPSNLPHFTQPNVDSSRAIRVTIQPGEKRWVEIDLTPLVAAWVSGELPNYGIRFAHRAEGPPFNNGAKRFTSSDSEKRRQRPKLTIALTGPRPEPRAGPAELEAQAARKAEADLVDLLAKHHQGRPVTPEMLQTARRIVVRAPFLGRAWWTLARFYLSGGRGPDDLDSGFFALEQVDRGARPFRSLNLFVLRGRTRLFRSPARLEQAHRDLTRAFKEKPRDPTVRALYGSLFFFRGLFVPPSKGGGIEQFSNSRQVLRRVIRRNDLPWEAYASFGGILMLDGALTKATYWLKAAQSAEAKQPPREGNMPRRFAQLIHRMCVIVGRSSTAHAVMTRLIQASRTAGRTARTERLLTSARALWPGDSAFH